MGRVEVVIVVGVIVGVVVGVGGQASSSRWSFKGAV